MHDDSRKLFDLDLGEHHAEIVMRVSPKAFLESVPSGRRVWTYYGGASGAAKRRLWTVADLAALASERGIEIDLAALALALAPDGTPGVTPGVSGRPLPRP